jgi:hypothetical protein
MSRRRAVATALTALSLAAAGCGSSHRSATDTNDVVDGAALAGQLRSLKPGEILIIGRKSRRTAGPFTFKPGGYLFHFTQPRRARLRVELRAAASGAGEAHQLLADTTRTSGTARVHLAGRLYVDVVATAHSYTLRFTPRGAEH